MLSRLKDLLITTFISDRHVSIASHTKKVLTRITHYFDIWYPKKSKLLISKGFYSIFKLENIYYFLSCSGGSIPSLPIRHLETRGSSHMKRQGMLVGKFEFNSYGRLMWTMRASLDPKKIPLKTEQVRLLASVQERIQWALVDPTRVIETSAEIKPENRN